MTRSSDKTGEIFLFITQHDYRSARKASVHFIAEQLVRRGEVRMFSLGFSFLSVLQRDPRLLLNSKGNKIERYNEVYCYLWKSIFHPVNVNLKIFRPFVDLLFACYPLGAPKLLKKWGLESTHIIIESGMPVVFFKLMKRLNPRANIIYLCSDDLETLGCAKYLSNELNSTVNQYTTVIVPSRKLADKLSARGNIYFVPHSVDLGVLQAEVKSPFKNKVNAVSVGSTLFDAEFFCIAARAFPEVTFHVIGGGKDAEKLRAPNISVYGEMPFADTIAFLKYADFGIAAYQGSHVSDYLADTSMKLMQYGRLGLPAVCPQLAVGNHSGRFGYLPDNENSIVEAIKAVLAFGRFSGTSGLSWSEAAERVIDPVPFEDTKI